MSTINNGDTVSIIDGKHSGASGTIFHLGPTRISRGSTMVGLKDVNGNKYWVYPSQVVNTATAAPTVATAAAIPLDLTELTARVAALEAGWTPQDDADRGDAPTTTVIATPFDDRQLNARITQLESLVKSLEGALKEHGTALKAVASLIPAAA
jgi:hypothetical protein